MNASWRDDVPAATAAEVADYEKKKAKYEAATKDIQAKMDAICSRSSTSWKTIAVRLRARDSRLDHQAGSRAHGLRSLDLSPQSLDHAGPHAQCRAAPEAEGSREVCRLPGLEADLKKFDKLKPKELGQLSTITELGHADAPPTYVLFKGIYDRKLEEVQPGFPALFTDTQPEIKPTATSSGRRTALANWIVSPENPLTARVFVNRVWGQYFGRAIVETVGDFGKMGAKPTNPELLDYLADSFVRDGNWSIKALQRQILLSATYRQSSAFREDAEKAGSAEQAARGVPASAPRRRADPRFAAAGRGSAR